MTGPGEELLQNAGELRNGKMAEMYQQAIC